MLTAVNGYIDGNRVVVEENISDWQGRKVVVTILDTVWNNKITETKTADYRKEAALELAGLWKDHENELSVEDTVRKIRKGRNFDI